MTHSPDLHGRIPLSTSSHVTILINWLIPPGAVNMTANQPALTTHLLPCISPVLFLQIPPGENPATFVMNGIEPTAQHGNTKRIF